jgi:hypothetical protein
MTLAEFHTSISRAIRRGTSQDDIIPDVVSDAAAFLEQNYTFSYMRRTVQVTLDPTAMAPERIDYPSPLIKRFYFIRIVNGPTAYAADPYCYLRKVDARDVSALSYGPPVGYYTDGATQIVLDSVVQASTVLDISYAQYTDWPTDASQTPTLLAIGRNVLRSQTLLQLAEDMRDPRMVSIYTTRRNEGLTALLQAAEEDANSAPASMEYRGLEPSY